MPVLLLVSAKLPTAVFSLPVVLAVRALVPCAVLYAPDVLFCRAFTPIAALVGLICPAGWLFTLNCKGCASVVPTKSVVGLVPAFPVKFQPL